MEGRGWEAVADFGRHAASLWIRCTVTGNIDHRSVNTSGERITMRKQKFFGSVASAGVKRKNNYYCTACHAMYAMHVLFLPPSFNWSPTPKWKSVPQFDTNDQSCATNLEVQLRWSTMFHKKIREDSLWTIQWLFFFLFFLFFAYVYICIYSHIPHVLKINNVKC